MDVVFTYDDHISISIYVSRLSCR